MWFGNHCLGVFLERLPTAPVASRLGNEVTEIGETGVCMCLLKGHIHSGGGCHLFCIVGTTSQPCILLMADFL